MRKRGVGGVAFGIAKEVLGRREGARLFGGRMLVDWRLLNGDVTSKR